MREISLDIFEEDRISINYEVLLIVWWFLKDQGFNVDEVEMGNVIIKNVLFEGDL